jgi:2-dehydro-3-deoxy-D-gluconate 5-dehydrogenase
MTTDATPVPTPLADLVALTGRTAIVTGGAMGIGAGIAARLAEAGAAVLVADLDGEAAEATAKQLRERGLEAGALRVDVADEADVARMVDTAVERYGGVDVLVNNAGIFPSTLLMRMSGEDFDRVVRVNLHSVFSCTKAVARVMIDQGRGGRIINVTSIDALHPSSAGLAHYDASKHGVWGFTKNVALELAPHGITVNAIAPGAIATPGTAAASPGQVPEGVDIRAVLQAFLARIPLRRMGEPDDIGRVALFLASDLASYMTGSQVVVDGGALLS